MTPSALCPTCGNSVVVAPTPTAPTQCPHCGQPVWPDGAERRSPCTPERPGLIQRLASWYPFLTFVAVVGGAAMAYGGWQEARLASLGSAEPQEITAADLAANGPGTNIHVRVSDFTFGGNYVVETRNDVWKCVWIPMFPGSLADAEPTRVRIIVKSSNIDNQFQLTNFCQRKTVDGLITNSVHSLGRAELDKLREAYPGIDFSQLWVLEDRRSFATSGKVVMMLGFGIVMILFGALFGYLWYRHRGAC